MARLAASSTQIWVDPAGATSYERLFEVVSFAELPQKRQVIDGRAIHEDDPRPVPDTKEPGSIDLTFIWDPEVALHAALETAFASRQLTSWRVVYAATGLVPRKEFKGYIVAYDMQPLAKGSLVLVKITIQIHGGITTQLT